MLQYLESGAGAASNLPPSANSPQPPRPERVRHLLYGSLPALDRTIKILHALGYADPNDWSDPLPVPQGGGAPPATSTGVTPPSAVEVWMVILTKTLLME